MSRDNPTDVSQNISWTMQKGSWVAHFIVTFLFLLVFRTFFSNHLAWQLTVFFYNTSTFIFFHWIVGDPFDHSYSDCTFWEQMCEQLPNSRSIVFLRVFPVLLFIVCNHMVEWGRLFYPCVISLCLVVVPKLEFMHKKRLFGLRDKK
ncbi:ORM1-like protein 3 [Gurleya vavrai]